MIRFDTAGGILLPFLGTILGSACVFFMKNIFHPVTQKILIGFSAGVMTAAAVWSLLLPSLELSASLESFSFLPAAAGFWIGILFLMFFHHRISHTQNSLLLFAVFLHNIPEGICVGAVFAGTLGANACVSLAGALSLSFGIAVQNIPEGAIISMPLQASGTPKGTAFGIGALSGAIEPLAALLTLFAAGWILPILPYLLSFAAGAMFYVIILELIPEMTDSSHPFQGLLMFAAGFTLMMAFDVAFG